jgi:hypothetical protein
VGIAAAQQADVVDLLDQHDQPIEANTHGQSGPPLTWQMAFVEQPRMDFPAFEDLDPPLIELIFLIFSAVASYDRGAGHS